MHKFTCHTPMSVCWFLHSPWAGGLQPQFCANADCLLNTIRSGKMHRIQLSKQWGRGARRSPKMYSVVFLMQISNPRFWRNLSHKLRNREEARALHAVSLLHSIVKPSAERETLHYVGEGSQSHPLEHISKLRCRRHKIERAALGCPDEWDLITVCICVKGKRKAVV